MPWHSSDVASKSEVADETMEDNWEETESDDAYSGLGGEGSSREWWGARMTKAAMVPPLTRKYEVVEEYRIVDDIERVALKMKVTPKFPKWFFQIEMLPKLSLVPCYHCSYAVMGQSSVAHFFVAVISRTKGW